jgi:peroxiredoxin Q/BCP
MLAAQTTAPDFTLTDQNGKPHSLSGARGPWVLLWWYPEASSGGCSIQAASLASRLADFTSANTAVWGISFNSTDENDTFSCSYDLGFPLLSDAAKTTGTEYGVLRDAGEPFEDKPRRITFVIDPEGQIVFSELVLPDAVNGDGERAFAQVQAAQAERAAGG